MTGSRYRTPRIPTLRPRILSLISAALMLLMSGVATAQQPPAAETADAAQDAAEVDAGADATSVATSADAPFDASMTVEFTPPKEHPVGEPLQMDVAITHPAGVTIITPAEVSTTTRWGLTDARVDTPAAESTNVTSTVRMTFVPWRAGRAMLGPLALKVLGDGGDTVTLETEAYEVYAVSNLPEATADSAQDPSLRGARPPVADLPRGLHAPLWAGAGTGGAALLALLPRWMLALRRRRL